MKPILFLILSLALGNAATTWSGTKNLNGTTTFPKVTAANSTLFSLDGAGALTLLPQSTFATAASIAAAYQPLDADLTTWAGITPGTGIATSLAINTGTAGSVQLNNGSGAGLTALNGTSITTGDITAGRIAAALGAYPATINGTTITASGGFSGVGTSLTALNANNITTGTLGVSLGGTGTTNGSITGTGALTFTAGTGNNNVTVASSGTGSIILKEVAGTGDKTIVSFIDSAGTQRARISTNYIEGTIQALNAYDFGLNSAGLHLYNTLNIAWSASGAYWSTKDTGIRRSAAGVVEINNGTAGGAGSLKVNGGVTQSPPATATPATNGQMLFEATSNTSVTLKLKGTDGTVRSVVLTLAP